MKDTGVAIILAAGLVSAAIFLKPLGNSGADKARYSAFQSPGGIARLDTRTGEVIECYGGRCVVIIEAAKR